MSLENAVRPLVDYGDDEEEEDDAANMSDEEYIVPRKRLRVQNADEGDYSI